MKFWMGLLLLLCSQWVAAGALQDAAAARALSDRITAHFLKGEFVQGLDLAKPYWPLPEVEIDGLVNNINTQWVVVQKRFGAPVGTEFVREERLGTSFIRYYYLHKFDNHALYWRFTYYRASDDWKINGITFQDSLQDLFVPVN